jgi:hypothetical protein
MNRPHIFLDIDGVLATVRQFYMKKRHEEYNCYRFDPKCVKVFNDIIEKTDAIIVLSSDWRDHYSIKTMNNIFEWNAVNATVSKYTPSLWGIEFFRAEELEACRAAEILKFVKDNDVKKWVAIDDLDLKPYISEENFVWTPRANEGIKQSGVKDKILKRLL